ncbi:MAG: YjgN family protein [Gammaproteobacteria bacterium]|nr:YjgN family protein [Gammaproteobacteria bacterium]
MADGVTGGTVPSAGLDAVLSEPAQSSPEGTGLPNVRFTGSGWEYFRIWAVNTALTLLTLGVFSAWATVRTRRYFYGNTWLGGSAFNYTARPWTILIGRVIVVGMLVALWFAELVSIAFYLIGLLVVFAMFPWIAVRARAFRLRNSFYRHVCWGFEGNYATAAKYYCLGPIVGFLSLGILWPYIAMRRDMFLIRNSRFGTSECSIDVTAGQYYGIYFSTFGIFGAALVANTILVAVLPDGFGFLLSVVTWIPLLLAGVFIKVRLDNLRWSNTTVGGYWLSLDLSFWRMLGLYLSNLVLIVITLGAFIPFAKVRVIRYRLGRFRVVRPGAETFFAGPLQTIGAVGAEAGDSFGLDLGI